VHLLREAPHARATCPNVNRNIQTAIDELNVAVVDLLTKTGMLNLTLFSMSLKKLSLCNCYSIDI
jgi:hypothetical protein